MANPRLAPNALMKPSQRNGSSQKNSTLRIRKTSRYEILKDKIRTWWNDRLAIGESLKEIRDGKLYKDEYPNFEDFCFEEFELKHSQAYGLIAAVEVKESLKPSAMAERITNERQARALAPVPAERRAEVLQAVVEKGAVTARAIKQIAQANGHTAKKETKPTSKDKIGCPIPNEVLSDWREAESFDDLLKQVHRIKLRVDKALEERELPFREITNSTVADLHNAWSALQGLIPYAVCPTCEGHNRENCTLCKQRGFLSKFAYGHYVSKKARELREKLYAA